MRNLEETKVEFIPEEIALQEAELLHLTSAVTDQHEAIKLAYAAGAEAMMEFDNQERLDESDALGEEMSYIQLQLILSYEQLETTISSCFDNDEFNGNIAPDQKTAAEWAYRFYPLIKSTMALVSQNLHRIADDLERYT